MDEVRSIRDKAEAVRVYAKQAGMSLEMQNQCCEIRLRAERRAGELLSTVPRQKPGEYQKSKRATLAPSLSDLGVNKSQSSRWQQLYRLPEKEFDGFIESTKAGGRELTARALNKLAREFAAGSSVREPTARTADQEVERTLEELAGGPKKFGCIYADPPWPYKNQGTRGSTNKHYPTMELDEIAALPVTELCAPDCHLHLWTTNAHLFESKRVMDAWGFTYKSVFVWAKPQLGLGNYWRVSQEYLLLGVRGSCPFRDRSVRSWMEAPRTDHSEKPAAVRNLIEKVSPGPFLELFARVVVPGWTAWGNQVRENRAENLTALLDDVS